MDAKIAGAGGAMDWRLMQEPASGIDGQQLRSVSGNKSMTEKEKLGILAKEFESVFMGQMLQSMRSTVQKGGLIDGGHGEEMFSSMIDSEMARKMAYSQNSPLATALVEQMSAKLPDSDGKEAQPALTRKDGAQKAYKQDFKKTLKRATY